MIIILLLMKELPQKVVYKKISSHGAGPVPPDAEGKVLLYVDHPVTVKLLVDFAPYGKAIVPLSSVRVIEKSDD